MERTWDGLPIADDLPTGTVIAVFRRRGGYLEWLVLHRAHCGPAFDGDWAWGAPSGCRLPGEAVEACAHRELLEETGLDLSPAPLLHDDEWPLFVVEAPTGTDVRLSREHDAHRWADLLTACELIKPERVAEQLRRAARLLQSSGASSAT
jgi:8-oxo-dGTP pyrophosphatase MutT (NUDIX family)